MSIPSHKSSAKKTRSVQAPQRANGKLRVAAILEAAAAVITENGYEGATMAEIAARSGTKIGSLYRFFPNKESLADTIVVSARENVDAVFDKLDAAVKTLSSRALADEFMNLLLDLLNRPALVKLLDASQDWSVKPEEFKSAVQQRIVRTLAIYSPTLPMTSAEEIALVILLNTKTVAMYHKLPASEPAVLEEFREMARLYLHSRLGPGDSGRKGKPSQQQ